tara:strand:+ start:3606 stop:3989 length:384 start_codon:yes stop_codon:yes gene_type:complete
MPGSDEAFETVLVAPLAAMIRQVGMAVADAQTHMAQTYLDQHNQLSDEMKALGVMPSWYEMSQIDVELKLAIHLEQEVKAGKPTGFRLFAASHNAQYQNAFNYTADGASTMKLRLSPVPSPLALQPR